MIYLDNAATTCPKPPQVVRAVSEAAVSYCANPGRGSYPAAEESGKAVFGVRSAAAEFFGAASPENIIFTAGCTASINYVLKGCLRAGDHVIISDLEHNAVVRPLYALERRGVEATRVNTFLRSGEAIMNNFRRAMRKNTKMIFCTHVSNVFGSVLPVERIGELCRRNGLLFGIDAAQSAGVLPLSLKSTGADFICAPAHKGLYGVMGLGLLALSGEHVPESILEGGTGSLSAHREQPHDLPDRLESGTLNVPGICALGAGLDAVNSAGRESIYRHELALMRYLCGELSRMGHVKLYTPPPEYGRCAPLLSFNIGDMPSAEAGERLGSAGIAVRAGYHCAYDAHMAAGTADRGTVRVCPSMFTTQSDIDTLLKVVYSMR